MDPAEVVEDILAHTGVKGMKWGVRRKATVGPTEVIVSDKRKKIKTSGGKGHPAHPDAVSARTIGQISKKSGFKALSNKQLQEYNNRLNLEQNASRLRHHEQPAAKKFINTLLRRELGKGVESGLKDPSGTSLKVRKRMATGAMALALA